MYDTVIDYSKNPILLGEAPKGDHGYPFDYKAWTSHQIADAVGYNPENIHKYFVPKNLIDVRQGRDGFFDKFDEDEAAIKLDDLIKPGRRIICISSRVSKVIANYYGMDKEEMDFYIPLYRWGNLIEPGIMFARVHHPSSAMGRQRFLKGENPIPWVARNFLVSTIRERYPSFRHSDPPPWFVRKIK